MTTILKGFKYRLRPNKGQEESLSKHFGCNRWVYNYGLEQKISTYKQTGKSLTRFEIQKHLPKLKQQSETAWLAEVNAQSLQASLEHLDRAYRNFFRTKTGFPKFKCKYNKQSFSIPQYVTADFEKRTVYLPKIGDVQILVDRPVIGKIKSATISKTTTGKYFVSLLCDTGIKEPKSKPINGRTAIGIDLGLKDFVALSNGEKITGPKVLRNHLKQLAKHQRQVSKKVKGSKNRQKAKHKVASLHEKIANVRKDFLQKLSTKLIRENQTICLEDLNVAGMVRNHCLALSISDAGWGQFGEMLKYKARWNGNNLLTIGCFEPSSKMCHNCGYINHQLTLADRTWVCPQCIMEHDRDVNAAINIKDFAMQQTCKSSKQLNVGAERPEVTPVKSGKFVHSLKQETEGL